MLTVDATVTAPTEEDAATLFEDIATLIRKGKRVADGCDGIGHYVFTTYGEEEPDEDDENEEEN